METPRLDAGAAFYLLSSTSSNLHGFSTMVCMTGRRFGNDESVRTKSDVLFCDVTVYFVGGIIVLDEAKIATDDLVHADDILPREIP